MARSIRRVIRYEYGGSPYARLNSRLRWPADMWTPRARASTSSGSAYSRSIRSRTRRSRTRSFTRWSSVASVTSSSCHARRVDDPLGAVDRAAEANARFRPVEIDGAVVTRLATAGTSTVHGLLRHLRAHGVAGV